MTLRPTCIAVTLSFFLFPIIASAQEPVSSPTPDEKAQALEKKVFDLVESIAARAATLHSVVSRVRVESALIDLFWIKDEKRARAIFTTVTQEVSAMLNGLDTADPQSQETLQSALQLRMEVVDRIASRDPELALSFLRNTRVAQLAGARYNGATNSEAYLETHLANLIAGNDPERALRIGRDALSQGFSHELTNVLSQLQQKDKERAQTFYREIVDKLKNENLARNPEAANVAANLLSSFRPPQADEQTYRDLVETLTGAALAAGAGDIASRSFSQNLYNQIRSQVQEIEKYVPSRVAALRRWSQSMARTADPYTAIYAELNEVDQKGSVDDLLALASKYAPEMQAQVYQRALWKALSGGDANHARQIADLISDPAQRRNMLDQIDRQLMWNAINEGRIADARQLAAKIATVGERVQFLTALANKVAGKGDKKAALGLLDEAESLLASAAQNSSGMNARMQVAQAYSALDLERSFAIMQPLVTRLNELIAAAVVLDGFENRYLKEDEWVSGAGSVGNLANNMNQNLAALARFDFDRASALADQLERPEVRLMAQLQIVQVVQTDKTNGRCNGCNLPLPRRGVVVLRQW